MTKTTGTKKVVWKSLFQLIQPFKKKLLWIFFISLVGTSVKLVEPIVYKEAINDITGLFVQKARNDVKRETGQDIETDNNPVTKFIEGKDKSAQTTVPNNSPKQRVKQAHSKGHVAPRTPGEAFDTLFWAVIILFIVNVVGLVLWWIGDNMNVRLSCTIERTFIQKTFRHVLKLPLGFFAKRSTSALHKQIDQSEEVSGIISVFTKQIFPEIVSLIGIIAIMFWQNSTLTLLALSIVPVYILISLRSTKKLETSLSDYYEKFEEVSSTMQDALGGIKTVKLSGAEEREVERLNSQTAKAYKDYITRSRLANKYAFWEIFLTHIASAAVLAYGGYLTLMHQLTPGDVVMFVAYIDMLYDPIDNLTTIWNDVQQNVTSLGRSLKLLEANTEEKSGKEFIVDKGNIEFKKVHFSYNEDREILKGLTFTAKSGTITAIVGTSGSGKTTTVDLLLKLFEPQKGKILIDGQNLVEMDGSSVRRNIGMVTADGAVFRGSLADNIRYKRPDATNEEVHAAAMAAGMKVTIERLPDGIDTMVGESGFGLSVGEKQRIQIARVLVSKPKILILDEATANLDYATEAEVKKTVQEIRKENTVIVIAHRFSMVQDADHVIVLDNGKILEEGSPSQLLKKGGWFADFANANEEDVEDYFDDKNEEEEDIEEEE